MKIKRKRKKFVGWAITKSINGSNWGRKLMLNLKEWPIVSEILPTKKEAEFYYKKGWYEGSSGMNPCNIRRIYK